MLTLFLSLPFSVYAVLALTFYFLYKFAFGSYNLEEKFGFKGPKPLPVIGNIWEFRKHGFHKRDVENQKKYGHIYPIYVGRTGMLIVSDEDIMRQVLVKEAKSFIDRPIFRLTSKTKKLFLTQLNGKDWERVRTILTPTFTSGKLKKMSPMVLESVKEMVQQFSDASDGDISVKEIFGNLTMDVIAKTMFGIDLGVSKSTSNAFTYHASKLFTFSISDIFFLTTKIIPQMSKVYDFLFPNGIGEAESMQFFQKCVNSAINTRKNSTYELQDFLALILKSRNKMKNKEKSIENELNQYKCLTEEEIQAQCIVFLLAGYETTASVMTFCSYYLAKNPDIQEEVYRDIIEKASGKEITYDTLIQMNLLEQSINETLRICPPAPRVGRTCTMDTTLKTSTGQIIQAKKGMHFVFPVYAIHHDESLWPDPEKFDIHRFDYEEKKNMNAFTFMPFGMGPRNCIGMRFALLEAKLALAYLLIDYKILPCKKTPKSLIFGPSGLTKVLEPVYLRVEKRRLH